MILDEIFEQSFRRSADDDLALTFAESVEDAVFRHHDDLAFVVTMATHIHLTLATRGGDEYKNGEGNEAEGRKAGGGNNVIIYGSLTVMAQDWISFPYANKWEWCKQKGKHHTISREPWAIKGFIMNEIIQRLDPEMK